MTVKADRTYTISQLAREFEVTPRALRFYEDKGLLMPRREGMNRVYSHRDRGKLQLILRGKRVGLSLIEIKEILDLYSIDQRAQAQTALKRYKARVVVSAEDWDLMDRTGGSWRKPKRDIVAKDGHLFMVTGSPGGRTIINTVLTGSLVTLVYLADHALLGLFLPDTPSTVAIAEAAGVRAFAAGVVEAGPKRVVIEPLGLTFGGDDLHVRA